MYKRQEVYNEVTINLSGEVWLDGQTGIKPVKEPDNKKGQQKIELKLSLIHI